MSRRYWSPSGERKWRIRITTKAIRSIDHQEPVCNTARSSRFWSCSAQAFTSQSSSCWPRTRTYWTRRSGDGVSGPPRSVFPSLSHSRLTSSLFVAAREVMSSNEFSMEKQEMDVVIRCMWHSPSASTLRIQVFGNADPARTYETMRDEQP